VTGLLNRLERWPPGPTLALCLLLLALIGVADHLSGPEIAFAIFYVVPVSLAAWLTGRGAGLLFSLLAATAWYTADRTAGHLYSHEAIPAWNAFTRLALFVIIASLIAAFHASLREERRRARTDGMTGLLNSRAFYEAAHGELERCRRYHHPLSVAYIDLDDFKQINDSLGHTAGDDLLRQTAAVMGSRRRTSDLAARLGGDEFAILLPESDPPAAAQAVDALRRELLSAMRKAGWPVTFSIGVVTFTTPRSRARSRVAI
jgi:diguanylate cyclase (GGDEF)-like protein